MTKTRFYRVRFKEPPLSGVDRREFFFTSLTAIYEEFTVAQIGCAVENLYNLRVPSGQTYENDLCSISQDYFTRKTQNNPATGRTSPD